MTQEELEKLDKDQLIAEAEKLEAEVTKIVKVLTARFPPGKDRVWGFALGGKLREWRIEFKDGSDG